MVMNCQSNTKKFCVDKKDAQKMDAWYADVSQNKGLWTKYSI